MAIESEGFAVTFRDDNPHARARAGVYEQALELTVHIDRLIDRSEARFHHKVELDRCATIVAARIAQAAGEIGKAERRNHYRASQRAATDVAVILDILARRPGGRGPEGGPDLIAPARVLVIKLIEQLAVLATR